MLTHPLTSYAPQRSILQRRESDCLFSWDGADGTLTARTGEAAIFSRAATGTATDRRGTSYTAVNGVPRWEQRDADGDGVREALGVLMGTSDDLAWTAACLSLPPATLSLLLSFAEAGTRASSGAGLLYVGNDAASGARLLVDSTGSNYRLTVHNGTTSQSATISGGFPATAAMATALVQLVDDGTNWTGRLVLSDRYGPNWAATAWTTPIARATAWPASSRVRLNRPGTVGTAGAMWARALRLAWGERSAETLAETW